MTSRTRPLSPHLHNYRFPLVALLSISHRLTGLALVLGALLLVYWLAAAAYGPAAYDAASHLMGSPIGYVVLFGFTVALSFHLANGIRHLFWDVGKGFDLPAARRSGQLVLAATVVLTLLVWGAALFLR